MAIIVFVMIAIRGKQYLKKKSVLNLMFPKTECDVPESIIGASVRFFNGNKWRTFGAQA